MPPRLRGPCRRGLRPGASLLLSVRGTPRPSVDWWSRHATDGDFKRAGVEIVNRFTRCRIGLAAATLAACASLLLASCGGGDRVGPGPDTPAALAIHSGDGQTARTGVAAAEPVRVRVTAQSGTGLSGVTVSFEVTAGGGSVPSSTAVTDANGIASPGRWTMGAPGPQELRASVAGLDPVVFRATALGVPAEIAAVAGAGQEAPAGTAVPVAPEVVVTDSGGRPLADIVVFFTPERDASVGSPQATTNAQGRATAGSWTLGSEAGTYTLVASIDAEGVAGNPLTFEAVALAGPVGRIVLVEGDGQESETKLPVPVTPRIQVTDGHGNGVGDIVVTFTASGDSEVTPAETRTDSLGFASVGKWILGTAAGATYRLTATARDTPSATATFTATATEAVYNIEVVHVSSSLLTDSQRRAFERAEQFWETAIRGNLDWSTVRKPSLEDCLAKNDITGEIPGDRVVDDLLIYVQIREIDGPAGVFGGAGPCQIRADNSLPVVGVMFFDRGDLDGLETNGHLEGTILHEMAHVIGFGTLWNHLGLLRNPASWFGGQDTHFTGEATLRAFREVGGGSYTGGGHVPVQHQGGEGVWNGHWREFVFGSELMTPFPDRGLNPLSVVSLASMVDIGYEGVDYSLADDYALPSPSHAAARHDDPEEAIDPDAEVLFGPIELIDREGNVVRVIRPSRP